MFAKWILLTCVAMRNYDRIVIVLHICNLNQFSNFSEMTTTIHFIRLYSHTIQRDFYTSYFFSL